MFNLPDMLSPEIKAQLDKGYEQRQLVEQIAKHSTAEQICKALYNTIIDYQSRLDDTQDVIMLLVNFGQSRTIKVTNIGYIGHSLIFFEGIDDNGNMSNLIQHINQLSFLLSAELKPLPEAPKRKIGFVYQEPE